MVLIKKYQNVSQNNIMYSNALLLDLGHPERREWDEEILPALITVPQLQRRGRGEEVPMPSVITPYIIPHTIDPPSIIAAQPPLSVQRRWGKSHVAINCQVSKVVGPLVM